MHQFGIDWFGLWPGNVGVAIFWYVARCVWAPGATAARQGRRGAAVMKSILPPWFLCGVVGGAADHASGATAAGQDVSELAARPLEKARELSVTK